MLSYLRRKGLGKASEELKKDVKKEASRVNATFYFNVDILLRLPSELVVEVRNSVIRNLGIEGFEFVRSCYLMQSKKGQ